MTIARTWPKARSACPRVPMTWHVGFADPTLVHSRRLPPAHRHCDEGPRSQAIRDCTRVPPGLRRRFARLLWGTPGWFVGVGGRASSGVPAMGPTRRIGVGVAVDGRAAVVLEEWIAKALAANTGPRRLALLHRAEAAVRHVIVVQAAILTGACCGWRKQCTKRNCRDQRRGGNCCCSQRGGGHLDLPSFTLPALVSI
jgi:hypothetical protein